MAATQGHTKFKNGLVSIITPLHNAEDFIGETIESVLSQSYTHFEMLIVNDHSTDSSQKIVEDYCKKDSRIKLYDSDGYGAAVARNLALRKAQGEFIAFLDSDDLWLSNKLERQLAFMNDKEIDFSYTPYEYIDEHSKPLGIVREVPETIDYHSSLVGCRIGCLSVVYRHEKAPHIQTADLKKRNDDALWLRIFKHIDKGYRLNEVLCLYRKSSNSLSSGSKLKLLGHHYRLYRINEGFGVLKSLLYTFSNVLVYLDVKKNFEHPTNR